MKSLRVEAPAKLNLALKVLNKRPDGFHSLETIFERIDLKDTLTLEDRADGKVAIRCDHPHVPTGPKNLVHRVARLMQERYGIRRGVTISIEKRIPVAAGLAGGSTNAAAMIQGLNRLWELKRPLEELVEIGKAIGSDVPFFLHDCSWALGTGRGDEIRPLDIPARLWHVLVVPKLKMYTPEVFGALNLELTKKVYDVNILIHYLRNNDITKVGRALSNDLESSIIQLRPKLLRLKEKLQHYGPDGVAFSGSGPSVFAVMRSRSEAEAVREIFEKRYTQVFVVKTF